MSDTPTNGARTLPTGPEPLARLTGAPAAIYTELVNRPGDDGVTAAELALAAGLGRSTTGKALVTLEELGLAVRTPGGHDGARRNPDHWRAAPTCKTGDDDSQSAPEPTTAAQEPTAANTPEPDTSHTDGESTPTDVTAPGSNETHTGDGTSGLITATAADTPRDTLPQADKHPHEDAGGNVDAQCDGGDDLGREDTPAPQTSREQPMAAPAETVIAPGAKKRLAPGALHQKVIDHLRAHPGEAFTATKISRMIDRSSGAIGNALHRLVKESIAEQVTEHPRTYRLATPDGTA